MHIYTVCIFYHRWNDQCWSVWHSRIIRHWGIVHYMICHKPDFNFNSCIQAFQNKWRLLYTFILVSLKSKLKVFMLFFIPCPLAVIRDRKKISTLFNSFGCVVNVISLVDNLVKFDFICFEMKKVFLCIKKYIWLFCYRS